jgi:hypothetical protein
VDQHASTRCQHHDRCLAGSNPLPPGLMAAEERLREVGQILAAGLIRLRWEKKGSCGNDLRDYRLDFPPGRSVHADTRQRRKAKR